MNPETSREAISRRRFLGTGMRLGAGAFAGAGLLGAAGCSSSSGGGAGGGGGGRVVYSTWGGTWQDAITKAWATPFEKQTGVSVVFTGPPDYGKIESMVKSGATEWDIAEVNPDFTKLGPRKNLLEPIDYSIVKMPPEAKQYATKYVVPQVLWSMVVTSRTDKFGRALKSWAEVWDTKQFPGKRAFDTNANGGVFEAALMADGVAKDKLYPIDVERALRKLDEIKGDLLWYESGAQQTQWLADGTATCGLGWDARIAQLKTENVPVDFVWDDSILTLSFMCVPRGARDKTNAMKFLNYTLSAKGQAAAAQGLSYGPVNNAAFDLLPKELAANVSGNPKQLAANPARFDGAWWGDNLDTVQQKLDNWRQS